MEGDKYVSMFKINGVPILPPLMTAARRREMLAYKELAVALETRLKLEAKERASVQPQDLDRISTMEDEYMKVSSMLQDHFSPAKLPPCSVTRKKSSNEILKKSDTFIYDINTNTVMISGDKEISIASAKKAENAKRIVAKSPLSAKRVHKITKHVAPSISIKPPTAESKSCKVEIAKCATPPQSKNQRASTSPSLKQSAVAPQLVRSNSFTLESPSPVLLEHMVRNRAQNSENLGDSPSDPPRSTPQQNPQLFRAKPAESFVVRVTSPKRQTPVMRPKMQSVNAPVVTVPTATSEPAKLSALLITNSAMFKNKKSPYDMKICGKPKAVKKHKTPNKKISAVTLKPRVSVSHHHRSKQLITSDSPRKNVWRQRPSPTSSPPTQKTNRDFVQDKILEIEEQQRIRLIELMKRQQEEQRILQEQFERQQKQLLEEFNAGLMSLKALSASNTDDESIGTSRMPPDLPSDSNNNSNSPAKTQRSPYGDSQCYDMTTTLASPVSNSKGASRCSRRLFTGCSPPPATPRQKGVAALKSARVATQIPSPSKRRTEAATIINAYVRGYLTRRLFRTEHVQNIVQTIRDTLLFVLDFHRETEHDLSEENILFKARLLQQLTSACHSLQSVFQLPTGEKMEIIARDRAYLRAKAKTQNKFKTNG
ncbi:uncharacterized protein LOC119657787 isoform X2 [Hermetia illucens]|uniref:uncharacterized protein LOC119657787 isoform X2 n=1 Tax=Hermetia illucens TaxID=343691 RepID=UPI0018CC6D84|nr:uncharacterized protein LOC119657787 isoform X2 [Hermetia illucens]